jgi:hypothetical protein
MGNLQRLASKKEMEQLIDFLAQKEWENILRYPYSPFGVEAREEGKEAFLKRSSIESAEAIGKHVLVSEFEGLDFCIFSLQHTLIDNSDPNTCYIFTQRIMRTVSGFEILDDEDAVFDLSEKVTKKSAKRSKRELNAGRPQRPTDESIDQAHQVIYLIDPKRESPMTVSDACKQVGIARNTYYRAAKWITENVPIYQDIKIR